LHKGVSKGAVTAGGLAASGMNQMQNSPQKRNGQIIMGQNNQFAIQNSNQPFSNDKSQQIHALKI
jgi:hypothetical protein